MKKGNSTKQKIYLAIEKLLETMDQTEISVQDICKTAGIGVGTFYHYYSSKNEAIYDISNPIDLYFDKTVIPQLDNKTPQEQLRLFFHYQAHFMINWVLKNGISKSNNNAGCGEQFYTSDRLTYILLKQIIEQDELFEKWKEHHTTDFIVEHLLCLSRGVINHWLGNDCQYNLEDNLWKHISMETSIPG